jgi:hypothetical protein
MPASELPQNREPVSEMSPEEHASLEAERDQLAAGLIKAGREQDVAIHGPRLTSAMVVESTPTPDEDEPTRLIAAAQRALTQKPRASDPEIARAHHIRGLSDAMRGLCQTANEELETLAVEIGRAKPFIEFLKGNPISSLVRRRVIVSSEEAFYVREENVLMTAEKLLTDLRKALERVPQIASLKDLGDAHYASRLLANQLQGCIGRSQLVREAAGNIKTFIRSLPERAREVHGTVTTLSGGGVSLLVDKLPVKETSNDD